MRRFEEDVAAMLGIHADCEGIGIDFEPWGTAVDPRAANLFLGPAERAGTLPPDGLLQLWTIKEALYKATPGSRGCLLLDFELHDTAASCGEATGPRGETLRYASLRLELGSLSIAVCDKAVRPARSIGSGTGYGTIIHGSSSGRAS